MLHNQTNQYSEAQSRVQEVSGSRAALDLQTTLHQNEQRGTRQRAYRNKQGSAVENTTKPRQNPLLEKLKTKQDVLDKLSQDMRLRNLSQHTYAEYYRYSKSFQDYFNKPAIELGVEDAREYLLYLSDVRELTPGTINIHNAAIRFLYRITLETHFPSSNIPMKRIRRSIPDILTREEIKAMLDACDNLRDKCILMVAYSAGLRVSEVAGLRARDIDGVKIRLFIEKGKGDKDRYAILAQSTLDTLREFWKEYRPKDHLFISRNKRPISHRAIQEVFRRHAIKAGITKKVSMHTLRHGFATHLLEDGATILHIKQSLGHSKVETTYFYLRLLAIHEMNVKSPMDTFLKNAVADGDSYA